MANLTDLQNRLQTIAEAEKNGGILDIPTEAIQILAMCNSIRIEMINEMCDGLDPEQCDEQLFIQLVSGSFIRPMTKACEVCVSYDKKQYPFNEPCKSCNATKGKDIELWRQKLD